MKQTMKARVESKKFMTAAKAAMADQIRKERMHSWRSKVCLLCSVKARGGRKTFDYE